jgi:hypothetical protein
MPKVEEFYHIYNKRWSATRRKRLRCASDTIILGILGTSNFRAPLELFFSVFEDKLLFFR